MEIKYQKIKRADSEVSDKTANIIKDIEEVTIAVCPIKSRIFLRDDIVSADAPQ